MQNPNPPKQLEPIFGDKRERGNCETNLCSLCDIYNQIYIGIVVVATSARYFNEIISHSYVFCIHAQVFRRAMDVNVFLVSFEACLSLSLFFSPKAYLMTVNEMTLSIPKVS